MQTFTLLVCLSNFNLHVHYTKSEFVTISKKNSQNTILLQATFQYHFLHSYKTNSMHLAFAEVQWLLTPKEFIHVFPFFCYSLITIISHCTATIVGDVLSVH